MHFEILWDDERLLDARQRFPLFYDQCLPYVPDMAVHGTRYALVCDDRNTVLAVMQQQYPFRGGGVVVTALVVKTMTGMHQLLRFFRKFMLEVQPVAFISCVR